MLRAFFVVMLLLGTANAQQPKSPDPETMSRTYLLNLITSLVDQNARLQASLQIDVDQLQAVKRINDDLNSKIDTLNDKIKELTGNAPEKPKN